MNCVWRPCKREAARNSSCASTRSVRMTLFWTSPLWFAAGLTALCCPSAAGPRYPYSRSLSVGAGDPRRDSAWHDQGSANRHLNRRLHVWGRHLSRDDTAPGWPALGRRRSRGRHGARTNRDAEGRYGPAFELARTLCLLAATAARATAVDAVYTDFRKPDGLRAEAETAARDGFTAKAAIHPAQAPIINEVFTPSSDEIAHARRVVELFEGGEATSVVALDGKMLDRPHLTMAKRLLSRARPG